MFHEHPYRTSGASGLECPRCSAGLDGDLTRRMTCANGCGEWWMKAALDKLLAWRDVRRSEPDVASLIGVPFPPGACPCCAREMTVSLRGGVSFDYCDAHGVWLDRGERDGFARAFALHRSLLAA